MTARRPATAGRRLRSGVGALLLAAAAAVALSGCTSARNALGTPVDTCYRALPVAARAVHHRGSFSGVLLLGRGALAPADSLGALVARRGGPSVRSVCVVVFHGSYDRGDVRDPADTAAGTRRWGVVLVSTPANRLLGTVLVAKPPFNLRDLI